MATQTQQQGQRRSNQGQAVQPPSPEEAKNLLDQVLKASDYNGKTALLTNLLDRVFEQTDARGKTKVIGDALMSRVETLRGVLPDGLKSQAERLIKRAIITFNRTPDLQACPPDVFIRCVIQAAELGMAIDGRLCYVVKYKNEFQVQLDYKGLVAVAKRSGQIKDCKADIVCQNDEFSYTHTNGRDNLRHHPVLTNRGDVIAAYASLILPDDSFRCLVMTRDELDKIENAAPSKKGPWATWKEEMQKKCPVRRILKMFCEDPGIIAAMAFDDDEVHAEPSAPDRGQPLPAGNFDLRTPAAPRRQPEESRESSFNDTGADQAGDRQTVAEPKSDQPPDSKQSDNASSGKGDAFEGGPDPAGDKLFDDRTGMGPGSERR